MDVTDPLSQYEAFLQLSDELYSGCTTEQKLSVYIQHRPANVVPFLLELILELHPENEDQDDSPSTD